VRKTDRRHQKGEQSRARILEATLQIAAERGYDGTSLALVSEATGLPASSIYWHFKNKEELLAETVEFSYVNWRALNPATGFPADPESPPRVIKDRLMRAAVTIAGSPHFWRLGLMLGLRSGDVGTTARQRYLVVRERSAAGMHEWYERLFPALDAELAERLTRCHLAMLDGLYVGSFSDPDWWENGSGERMLNLLSEGLHATALRWLEPA
jgi:AcrR family transcriptional regulator